MYSNKKISSFVILPTRFFLLSKDPSFKTVSYTHLVGLEESALSLEFKTLAVSRLLEIIQLDLKSFNTSFDVWSSEKSILSKKNVKADLLEQVKPYSYINEGALFLKTTMHGDDKDRVMIKNNGEQTYFLPDLIYHKDKIQRGFGRLIDILGADHFGYQNRIISGLKFMGFDSKKLHFIILQMVKIVKDGEELKLSKRTGNALAIDDLICLLYTSIVEFEVRIHALMPTMRRYTELLKLLV